MSFPPNIRPLSRTVVRILAGGRGDRLWPLTRSRPKPLLPLGPFRIIDFTLLNCLTSGLAGALLTQYGHDQLADHIRRNWNSQFHCLPPMSGKDYRGTADAVFQNLPGLFEENAEHVLILSGDHVYRMNFGKLLRRHVEADADVTISTIECPLSQASSFGVVEVDRFSRVTGFQEKPSAPRPLPRRPGVALVSMGIYAFKMKALVDALHATCGAGFGHDFGHHVLPWLMGSARVCAHDFRDQLMDMPSYWRDIGAIDTYHRVGMDLAQHHPPVGFPAFGVSGGVSTAPRVSSLSGSASVRRTLLCSGVRIEDSAEVEDSVLMPGVRVGQGARLRRAIVEEGVEIPPGSTVGWDRERDRQRYIVSPGGVAIVSPISHVTRPIPFPLSRERTVAPWGWRKSSATGIGRTRR